VFERHGMPFVRPLLAVNGDKIRAWVTTQGVRVVHDPSNADTSLTRNRIRLLVMPALERALPRFRDTFSRSARHAAQAQELLEQVAAQDLAGLGIPPPIGPLRALTRARQANLLRHWLRSAHAVAPSAAQLDELLAQVQDCATAGHDIRIKVATGFVVRRGAVLTFEPPAQD
jgi:tRNA(Ile)-lysidine synthase